MLKKHAHSKICVGVDEAGRGALAGPVVAAAVHVGRYYSFLGEVRDSKKLRPALREDLYERLTTAPKIYSGIGLSTVEEVDELNVLQATYLAMRRALDDLPHPPEHLYIDGPRFGGYGDIPYSCVVGGDDLYVSIGCASILAKVYRDRLMIDAHELYPDYDLGGHKGYGTQAHRDAIRRLGHSDFHRRTFKLKN